MGARLNFGGAFVVLLAMLMIGGTLVVQSTLGASMVLARAQVAAVSSWCRLQWQQRRERATKAATRERVVNRHVAQARAARGDTSEPAPVAPPLDLPPVRVKSKKGAGHFAVRKVRLPQASLRADDAVVPTATVGTTPSRSTRALPKVAPGKPMAAVDQQSLGFSADEMGSGELPPVNLLQISRAPDERDERELMRQGERLQQAAHEFGVEGTIEGVGPGPVITVFEFQPAPGVKVSRIVNLQDDLALAMKAESVRIDRMPGRSTLGMEVPNKKRSVIHLGTLLADDAFKRAKSPLTMAIRG